MKEHDGIAFLDFVRTISKSEVYSMGYLMRKASVMWIPSSFMPALPGKLFFMKELAGPLNAERN